MRHTLRPFIVGGALLAGLCSCRSLILEDRSECPAFLFFDIVNAERFDKADYVHVSAFVYPEETLLNKDTAIVRAIQEKEFSLAVKRSDSVYGYGVTGFKNCSLVGETDWVVGEGMDYDPIWRFDFRAEARGERFFIPVEMVKDHSRITVFFEDFDRFPGTDGHFPFDIIVTSNTCGINALTGEPVLGEFRYVPKESPGGTFKFTVPRQFDRTLTIHVQNKEEYFGNTEDVAEFSVWSWVHASEDFSWTEKNLPDIYVKIQLTTGECDFTVEPWQGEEGGYLYDI